jgi:hypothetical protein
MPAIIDSNSMSNARSLHGFNKTGQSNGNIEAARDFYRFQILYKEIFNEMTVALGFYSEENYQALINNYLSSKSLNDIIANVGSKQKYNNINITNLINYNYDTTLFNKYKASITNIYTGLEAAAKLYNENEELNIKLTNFSSLDNAIINNDNTYIINYIKNNLTKLQVNENLETEFELNIELKPWYTKYLIDYGPPINGIFDTVKLSEIIQLLVDEKIITIDEVLVNS